MAPSTQTITRSTIVIADDHQMVRQGLRLALEGALGAAVVEAETFQAAVDRAATLQHVDFMLVDLRMPGMRGGASIRELRQRFPLAKIVVISASTDRGEILEVLGAGAHGYIPKRVSVAEMTTALQRIMEGNVHVPRDLVVSADEDEGDTLNVLSAEIGSVAAVARLTPRQRDVLREIGRGHSTKEIARNLDLAEGTVKIHLAAIFRTLGVRNRTEAALTARKLEV